MAITRLATVSFETGRLDTELDWWDTSSPLEISTVSVRSGVYSLRTGGLRDAGKYFTATSQLRIAMAFNHNNPWGSDVPRLFGLYDTSNNRLVSVWADGSRNLMSVKALNTSGTEVELGTFDIPSNGVWHHIGMDVKFGTSGWCYVYLNGVQVFSYDGDLFASAAREFRLGAYSSLDQWSYYIYFDDIYVDDTTGEPSPRTPPDRHFLLVPVGSTALAGWNGSDGDQVDNHLLVDDRPHDADSTYVSTLTTGVTELYTPAAPPTAPPNTVLTRVGVLLVARKDAGDVQVAPMLEHNAVQAEGTATDPGTNYTPLLEWWDTPPGGGSWENVDPATLKLGMVSRGSFT